METGWSMVAGAWMLVIKSKTTMPSGLRTSLMACKIRFVGEADLTLIAGEGRFAFQGLKMRPKMSQKDSAVIFERHVAKGANGRLFSRDGRCGAAPLHHRSAW